MRTKVSGLGRGMVRDYLNRSGAVPCSGRGDRRAAMARLPTPSPSLAAPPDPLPLSDVIYVKGL